jgi:uncharacterized membrane protein HdeD (DUF308 family)
MYRYYYDTNSLNNKTEVFYAYSYNSLPVLASQNRSPRWLRLLQVVLGLISIGLSIAVLASPASAIVTVVILISVVLFIVGIERIASGISAASTKISSSIVNIGIGVLVLILASVAMAYPLESAAFLIILGAIALLFSGIARLIHGFMDSNHAWWSRAALIFVGILSIVISLIVLAHPASIGIPLLAFMLAVALIIIGIEMVALGVAGRRRFSSRATEESML